MTVGMLVPAVLLRSVRLRFLQLSRWLCSCGTTVDGGRDGLEGECGKKRLVETELGLNPNFDRATMTT